MEKQKDSCASILKTQQESIDTASLVSATLRNINLVCQVRLKAARDPKGSALRLAYIPFKSTVIPRFTPGIPAAPQRMKLDNPSG